MNEIEAIKELNTYVSDEHKLTLSRECIDLARKALEKQIAKKPIHVRYKHHITRRMIHFIYCGVCGPYQQRVSMGDEYCRACGTKIDWMVEE